MALYTAILLRPDYVTDNYGTDTFMETVEAEDPTKALAEVRRLAIEADGDDVTDPTDYFCIALLAGQHSDINPE